MINITELQNNIVQAMAELQTAQDMYNELEGNMVPLTVHTVDTMLKRIGKTVEPLVNIIQNIYDEDPTLGKSILWSTSDSRAEYPTKSYYHATFSIVDYNGELIPVFKDTERNDSYFLFACNEKECCEKRFGYNCSTMIRYLTYKNIDKYILDGFEATTYKAVEKYVDAVVKCLKSKTKERISATNKLTEILKQVAGDVEANEILCQNIRIGNGIRSVSMTENGIVVDICGSEYMLNINKIPRKDDDDDKPWLETI